MIHVLLIKDTFQGRKSDGCYSTFYIRSYLFHIDCTKVFFLIHFFDFFVLQYENSKNQFSPKNMKGQNYLISDLMVSDYNVYLRNRSLCYAI